ncbi:acetyl-CoA hydrolase/transferase family protein [Nocardia salmonicida]|uniref:acetyl-CoA hydrolase/transferase family protein n=1 Tax=Nocardia salmonicida TaxID=53431 RepID=UPI0036730CD2
MKNDEVIDALRQPRRIVVAPGCGTPTTLLDLVGGRSSEIAGTALYSGLLLCDYPFLDAVERGILTYGTWHVMPPVRNSVADGQVQFFPVRASQVPGLIRYLSADTAFIRVSPPDRHGFCSLGPSVSYPLVAVRNAELVIAEIDESVPRTRGEGSIHVSQIDLAIESQSLMPEYYRPYPDEISRRIAEYIVPLLPENPTIQIGIGSIPEALVDRLAERGIDGLRFAGMATDGMVDLHEKGLLDLQRMTPFPAIMAAELMGTRKLMDFAEENPLLGVYSTPLGITASSLWAFDRFVSINSAVEVDRLGQVSAEWVGENQFSGIGGSVDFTEAAVHSEGGLRIIAMASTNLRDSSSKIVHSLRSGVPVTVARHSVDYVVTEYGAAHLAFATTTERIQALASIAHPDHRDQVLGNSELVDPPTNRLL